MTKAQTKVLDAINQRKDDTGKNDWVNWQSLIAYGITGRAQGSLDALVKIGILDRRPYVVGYRLAA
mgnify:CR=1 FL=1